MVFKIRITVLFTTLLIISVNNSMCLFSEIASAQSLVINIDLQYDLYTHSGSVNQTIQIVGESIFELNIPLVTMPKNAAVDILTVVDERNNILLHKYFVENNTLTIYLNQSRYARIEYVIHDYFEELAPGLYTYMLDLSVFKNLGYELSRIEAKLTIISPTRLTLLDVEPDEGVSVVRKGELALITISKPLIYYVIVSHTFPEETPSIVEKPAYGGLAWLFITTAIVVAAGFSIYYFVFRRRITIEVETLPPNIIEDDTSRRIIEIIGDAGETGVKQSDLVYRTNRPKSSISRRVKRLSEEGYIEIIRRGKYNLLKLTNKGMEVYRSIKKKER